MERAWADLYWAGIETQVLVRYFYASVAGLLQPEAIRFWVISSVLVNQISGTRWIFITSGANVHNVKGQCQLCPSRLLVPKPCSTSRNHHYQVKAACSLVILKLLLWSSITGNVSSAAVTEHDSWTSWQWTRWNRRTKQMFQRTNRTRETSVTSY